MSTLSPETGPVDYEKSLDCIHCGLCLQSCPTFRLTGAEPSSPRGRIHLMRAVGEGRQELDAAYAEELDFCLLCRHCESVCPAGVRFGEMMAFARGRREQERPRSPGTRLLRWLGLRVLLPNRRLLRLAGTGLRLLQTSGLEKLGAVFGKLGAGLTFLPRIPPLSARRLAPSTIPSGGQHEVYLLQGCVMPELFARVNRATESSLGALGVSSRVPAEVVCCGSLHGHNGDTEGAVALAKRMIRAFEDRDELPVVVNSAGCGAHMRECSHLFEEASPWHSRARAFESRVVDYTEYVARLLEERNLELPAPDVPVPLVWDDPCHLCHGQGVRREPRAVLARMRDLPLATLSEPEACCGSAGIYSITHPEESQAVFEQKLADLESSGAGTLVTANPGCHLQWESGLRRAGKDVRVLHLAELVAAALHEATAEEPG